MLYLNSDIADKVLCVEYMMHEKQNEEENEKKINPHRG